MEKTESMVVAEKLVEKLGTQKKAAEAVKVTEVWFNKIINGKREPSKSLLALMKFVAE